MGFRAKPPSKHVPVTQGSFPEYADDPLVRQTIRWAEANGISTCPLAVEKLAKKLGATIKFSSSLPSNVAGHVIVDPDNPKQCTITLSNNLPENRRRFTVAHELGHYLKHNNWKAEEFTHDGVVGVSQFYRGVEEGGEEREANEFAAQLLMPAQMVLEAHRAQISLGEMAERFGVSKLAMKIRIEQLNLR